MPMILTATTSLIDFLGNQIVSGVRDSEYGDRFFNFIEDLDFTW